MPLIASTRGEARFLKGALGLILALYLKIVSIGFDKGIFSSSTSNSLTMPMAMLLLGVPACYTDQPT